MTSDEYLEAWQEATGCSDDPERYTKSTLEKYLPKLFEEKKFSGIDRTRAGRERALRALWDESGDALKIACAVGSALAHKVHALKYVFGCLKRFPDDKVKPQSKKPMKSGTAGGEEDAPRSPGKSPIGPAVPASPPRSSPGKNFIFLYRSIRRHPWFRKKPVWLRLMFIDLCLDAAWKDHEATWRGCRYDLKRGQTIMSERAMAREYSQSPKVIHCWLDKMEKEGMIQVQNLLFSTSEILKKWVAGRVAGRVAGWVAGGSVVTICQYDEFQSQNQNEVAGEGSGVGSGEGSTDRRRVLTEEGKEQNSATPPSGGPQPPEPPDFSSKRLFEIWNDNRGPLAEATTWRQESTQKKVAILVDLCRKNADNGRGAEGYWEDFVKSAAESTHAEHRQWFTIWWLAKDITRIDQVKAGTFTHSFGEGRHGKRSKRDPMVDKGSIKRFREDSANFGDSSGVDIVSPEMPNVPRRRVGKGSP